MRVAPSYALWLASAASFAGIAVALGAFAAHGLKGYLPDTSLDVFNTAVRYQMWHALALLAVTLARAQSLLAERLAYWASWFFLLGIVLFSGSLYGYILWQAKSLIYATPIGGTAFLMGWGLFAWSAFRSKALKP